MIPKEIVSKILWSTIEDFVGLWEIQWELNSLQKNYNNNDTAKVILTYLLNEDLVSFYFSYWGKEKVTEISKDEVLKLLANKKNWDPPLINERCIKVGSTERGEEYYNEDKINNIVF
jgi:hypothetical protein